MKGDFTRFTHRPSRGYDAVRMQQGRVTLDADFNEHVDLTRRRTALQTIDTIGSACAPEDAAGFGLSLTPDGTDIVIGTGRMYVEGLLVEVLPGTLVRAEVVDDTTLAVADPAPDGRPFAAGQWLEVALPSGPLLVRVDDVDDEMGVLGLGDTGLGAAGGGVDGEVRLRRVTTYGTQPFWPATGPEPLGEPLTPEAWADLRTLFYLEVWERHVTAVEDPALLEPALGGPDTATRIQVAWAVRVLRDDNGVVHLGDLGCGDAVEPWEALLEPTDARLSARAEAAADPLDPCDVPPEAGYRGLENRLYRVEVHEPGPIGTATFLWSRDNGTVVTGIRDFVPGTPFRVEVDRIGRDRELRFDAGDTVTVESDDTTAAGVPSTLSEVDGQPDNAHRLVPLTDDVSAFADHRRPRLRRWDGPARQIEVGWVELEDGVQVRFAGGPFTVGDWWVVPARTATGDVEGFLDAPPRGIGRLRTRLAIVDWADGSIEDCRSTFATLCSHRDHEGGGGCCAITVSPTGDTTGDVDALADAVALAARSDGPVHICLLPGHHTVAETVRIDRDDVTISGCGRRSPVTAESGGVLLVGPVDGVRLESLALRSASPEATVLAVGTTDLEVEDCWITNSTSRATGEPAVHGMAMRGASTVAEGGRDPAAVARAERERQARIAARIEAGATAEEAAAAEAAAEAGGTDGAAAASRRPGPALAVVRCRFVALDDLWLDGGPAAVLGGIAVTLSDSTAIGGVVVAQDSRTVEVRDNLIVNSPVFGVQLGLLDAELLERLARLTSTALSPLLIWLAAVPSTAFLGDIELDDTAIESVSIVGNVIGDNGLAGIGAPPAGATEVRGVLIADNRIVGNGGGFTERLGAGAGILLAGVDDIHVRGCQIEDNGGRVDEGLSVSAGILVADCHGLVVTDCTVRDNHPPPGPELVSLEAGIVGLMVSGGDPEANDPALLGGGAAAVADNGIRTVNGPGVVLVGAGPMTVADNRIVARYAQEGFGFSLGRAVVVVDLAVGTDARLTHGATTTGLVHGPVQFHDNHVVVQAAGGLEPIDRGDRAPGADLSLLAGSAVVLFSGDDVSIAGNQVANTLYGPAEPHIGASVWALASTVRAVGNRITEVSGTALFSYAATGQLAHATSVNIVTHCMTAAGTQVSRQGDIEMSCERKGLTAVMAPMPIMRTLHV